MPAPTGEMFRQAGFWSQLLLLGLLDWASLTAFGRQGAAWYHWVGLTVVNAALLGLTVIVWRWLRSHAGQSPKGAVRREQ